MRYPFAGLIGAVALLGVSLVTKAQLEAVNWYFGYHAGLTFTTGSPMALTGSTMVADEGCATMSDASGQLLMYTNGQTVWNRSHQVMANGTGLLGHPSATQSGLIVRLPGSNTLYYVFTVDAIGGSNGFRYSVVDMSLASGQGSVTVKNVPVYTLQCTEKITAVKHCNRRDLWIIMHEQATSNFRAYLLTSVGISTVVVSSAGPTGSLCAVGQLKSTPDGKRLGAANRSWQIYNSGTFEVYDFDISTGIVSNCISLGWYPTVYGAEFSGDGSKFYGTASEYGLHQWDVCQPTASAVIGSRYDIPCNDLWGLQRAFDGRIYISRSGFGQLGVIGSANSAGAACLFNPLGPQVPGAYCNLSLPFVGISGSPPVSVSLSCTTAFFSSSAFAGTSYTGCTSSFTSFVWNFGDPGSGAQNTSYSVSPQHVYPGPGTYTAMLISYSNCGSDTTQLVVSVPLCAQIYTTAATCNAAGSATLSVVATGGSFTYSWVPSGQTGSIATLSGGIHTVYVTAPAASVSTAFTVSIASFSLTGNLNAPNSFTYCGAVRTVSFNAINGSGQYSYLWTNGVTSSTNTQVSATAGNWTVYVSDTTTGCMFTKMFQSVYFNPISLTVSPNSPTVCIAESATLHLFVSGAVSPVMLSWSNGSTGLVNVVTHSIPGQYQYSVVAADSNGCSQTASAQVSFISHPTISVSGASVCVGETATLVATGALSYTWNGSYTGSVFPVASTVTAPIIVHAFSVCPVQTEIELQVMALPQPVALSNSIVCAGNPLFLAGYGGMTYNWSGPAGFSSANQTVQIGNVTPQQSGTYSVIVIAANSCSAQATISISVIPSPVGSPYYVPFCVNDSLKFFANQQNVASYHWTGPGWTATVSSPVIQHATTINNGIYTLVTISDGGCMRTTTIAVQAMPLPAISFSVSSPVCAGNTLSLSAEGIASFTWTGPGYSSSLALSVIQNVQIAAGGHYTLAASNGSCASQATADVIINPLPVVTISAPAVCEHTDLELSVLSFPSASEIFWNGPASFTSALATPVRSSAAPTFAGTYSVSISDIHGCSNRSTTHVDIWPAPLLTVAHPTACVHEQTIFWALGAQTYTWTGPSGFFSNASSFVMSNVTTGGAYTVTGASSHGCMDSVISMLTVFAPAKPVITAFSRTVCEGSSLTMEASKSNAYQWNGPGGWLSDMRTVTVIAESAAVTGVYTLTTYDANGCAARDTLAVTVSRKPGGALYASATRGCAPFCTEIVFEIDTNARATGGIVWDGIPGTNVHSLCAPDAGTYPVMCTIHSSSGCAATLTTAIYANPKPEIDFSWWPQTPVTDEEITLHPTGLHAGFQLAWFESPANTPFSHSPAATFTAVKPGNYAVVLTAKSETGCIDTAIKVINVSPELTCYMPNVFTPNGDNVNDTFRPVVGGVVEYEFSIFDRWGDMIFRSSRADDSWDGTYCGNECPEGTYSCRVKISGVTSAKRDFIGAVTLYR